MYNTTTALAWRNFQDNYSNEFITAPRLKFSSINFSKWVTENAFVIKKKSSCNLLQLHRASSRLALNLHRLQKLQKVIFVRDTSVLLILNFERHYTDYRTLYINRSLSFCPNLQSKSPYNPGIVITIERNYGGVGSLRFRTSQFRFIRHGKRR